VGDPQKTRFYPLRVKHVFTLGEKIYIFFVGQKIDFLGGKRGLKTCFLGVPPLHWGSRGPKKAKNGDQF